MAAVKASFILSYAYPLLNSGAGGHFMHGPSSPCPLVVTRMSSHPALIVAGALLVGCNYFHGVGDFFAEMI